MIESMTRKSLPVFLEKLKLYLYSILYVIKSKAKAVCRGTTVFYFVSSLHDESNSQFLFHQSI